jgi:phosphoglycolate phosphatase-like HAD superfamily hydrolase
LKTHKILLDFDGTLISNKARLFAFYYENIGQTYRQALDIDEFWSLKKLGIHEIEWLNLKYGVNIDIKEWEEKKLHDIESLHYLKYDKLFPFTRSTLNYLDEKYLTYLVTRRSNEENLFWQLTSLDLLKYFKDVVVIPHTGEPKANILMGVIKNIGPEDIIVGDTEDDIAAGIHIGVKTFFVLSGIRGKWVVQKYFSDQAGKITVIASIKELNKLI